jgi:hypothetical protein
MMQTEGGGGGGPRLVARFDGGGRPPGRSRFCSPAPRPTPRFVTTRRFLRARARAGAGVQPSSDRSHMPLPVRRLLRGPVINAHHRFTSLRC